MAYGLADRLYSLAPKSFKISPLEILREFYRHIFDGNGSAEAPAARSLIDSIDLSTTNVDSSYLESKMRELACARLDRKQPVLSSAEIAAIGPSIDQTIKKAIHDGNVSKIRMYANWGGHLVILERVQPAGEDYSLRVFQIV